MPYIGTSLVQKSFRINFESVLIWNIYFNLLLPTSYFKYLYVWKLTVFISNYPFNKLILNMITIIVVRMNAFILIYKN